MNKHGMTVLAKVLSVLLATPTVAFADDITVNAGETFSGSIPDGSNVTVSEGGILDGNNQAIVIGALYGSGTIINTTSGTIAEGNFSGTVDDTDGVLIKVGTGTLTLSGTNGYSGNTIVQGGTLRLEHVLAVDTSSIDICDGATLELAFDGYFRNEINGAGDLVIDAGNSSLELYSYAGHTGVTIVKSGTLKAKNTKIASTELTIYGNATFEGADNQTFSILNINCADADSGTATYSGNLSVTNGTLNFTVGSDWNTDTALLTVTGDADVSNSTYNISLSGDTAIAAGTTLTLISAGGKLTATGLKQGSTLGELKIGSTVVQEIVTASVDDESGSASGDDDDNTGSGDGETGTGSDADGGAGTGEDDGDKGTGEDDGDKGTGDDAGTGYGDYEADADSGDNDAGASNGDDEAGAGTGDDDCDSGSDDDDIGAGSGDNDDNTGPGDDEAGAGPDDDEAGAGSDDNEDGMASVQAPHATEGAKALSEGWLAALTLTMQGADLIADQGMSAATGAAVAGGGFGSFAAIGGGSVRYNSGSHIDSNTFSLMLGVAGSKDLSFGRLILGAFYEFGYGSYDTYNSMSGASIRGDGDSHYHGGGILARMDFTETQTGHPYAELSAHAGRIWTDYDNGDLTDASGKSASYDSSTAYWGFHLGGGYVLKLTEEADLDLYGKYFFTRQESDDLTLSTGESIHFDDADSRRLRLGAKAGYAFTEQVKGLLGLAWEYEFDGKVNATTNGAPIDSPSVKGHTGIAAAQLILTPSKNQPFDILLNLQGYAGKREGVTGGVSLKWLF